MQDNSTVIVPFRELSADALEGVMDAYILREGTDYGTAEYTLTEKRDSVFAMLESGEAVICFDLESEFVHIVLRDAL